MEFTAVLEFHLQDRSKHREEIKVKSENRTRKSKLTALKNAVLSYYNKGYFYESSQDAEEDIVFYPPHEILRIIARV